VKGGVLVFFPSYSVMDSSISHWKQIGIYDKLKNIVGNVISESRASVGISSSSGSSSNSQSSSFMTTKAKAVTAVDNASQLDQEFNSVVSEFNQSIDRYGGCVLMAVCRGKGWSVVRAIIIMMIVVLV
jgi:Rad3-related DNA helicase